MQTRVHRIEVRAKPGREDPRGAALVRAARAQGLAVRGAAVARVYLVEAALGEGDLRAIGERLLADPVVEAASVGAAPPMADALVEVHPLPGVMDPVAQSVRAVIGELVPDADAGVSTGWRYDLAGVGGAEAQDIARRLLANPVVHRIHEGAFVPDSLPRGRAYAFRLTHVSIRELTDEQLTRLSRDAHLFLSLDEMLAIQGEYRRLGREPTDIELETLAQTWSEHCVHKTLKSRIVYREWRDEETGDGGGDGSRTRSGDGGRRSSDVSFTFTPAGKVSGIPSRGSRDPGVQPAAPAPGSLIAWAGRPGHTVNPDGSVTIDNLLKSTVAAATHELIADGVDWTLSVFKDNSGVIAFDDRTAVCVKVETHNHPSAIEPYGGAATGIGGCIRDVIGTGLGAKPVASTDVFCVAMPEGWREGTEETERRRDEETSERGPSRELPPGTLHPRRILTDVVAGVRDYGNRMGIPTVNGAVYFDDRYVGNPLVFCGCVGVMPRDRVRGQAMAGDRIVALGGRTGRDGIHGATFSSAELEESSSDEFSHAVQIGNAIEEKRLLDAILRARDEGGEPLYHAITDCGAGGFSSAVGEMGDVLGAQVHLERAPLKYEGLSYTEIWISEAQERMVLAVPPANLPALLKICAEEGVELADLGHFGTAGRELILFYNEHEVGRVGMEFLHEGIPQPVREAVWGGEVRKSEEKVRSSKYKGQSGPVASGDSSVSSALAALLSHPNIASKHWIIRQYDHEVQGNVALKPLVGPAGRGPGDASVIEPVPGTGRGLAIGCGLATGFGDPAAGGDPYVMALAAIDECVRNLVCVGADPRRIAILDNFCWPSCSKPENLGALVRAAEGCYDGAKAYRTPFVSGKDSLNNQLKYTDPATGRERVIEIPPTLLITGIGIVPSVGRCVSMDAKQAGNLLVVVGETTEELGGSHYGQLTGAESPIPAVNLTTGPGAAQAVAEIIRQGLAASAHDCSDGGLLVAAAEMLIATSRNPRNGAGLLTQRPSPPLGLEWMLNPTTLDPAVVAFAETPGRYVLEVRKDDLARIRTILSDHGVRCETVGRLTGTGRLTWTAAEVDVRVDDLAETWLRPLDW